MFSLVIGNCIDQKVLTTETRKILKLLLMTHSQTSIISSCYTHTHTHTRYTLYLFIEQIFNFGQPTEKDSKFVHILYIFYTYLCNHSFPLLIFVNTQIIFVNTQIAWCKNILCVFIPTLDKSITIFLQFHS